MGRRRVSGGGELPQVCSSLVLFRRRCRRRRRLLRCRCRRGRQRDRPRGPCQIPHGMSHIRVVIPIRLSHIRFICHIRVAFPISPSGGFHGRRPRRLHRRLHRHRLRQRATLCGRWRRVAVQLLMGGDRRSGGGREEAEPSNGTSGSLHLLAQTHACISSRCRISSARGQRQKRGASETAPEAAATAAAAAAVTAANVTAAASGCCQIWVASGCCHIRVASGFRRVLRNGSLELGAERGLAPCRARPGGGGGGVEEVQSSSRGGGGGGGVDGGGGGGGSVRCR